MKKSNKNIYYHLLTHNKSKGINTNNKIEK